MKWLFNILNELVVFTLKQARACVFAGSFFVLLLASQYIHIPGIARYDLIFFGAILLQVILIVTKIETWDEVKTILLFHLIGFALEVFKVQPGIGSWAYPEPAFFKVWGVPLYSGFMYAAVASYMMQSWRIMQLRITNYPSYKLSLPLSFAIYLNFFTHHFLPDVRWYLTAFVFVIFWRTRVHFIITNKERWMPLTLSFVLIGFFVWVAENMATFLGAWEYPNQETGWQLVGLGKISSWGLLVIISLIIVADLKLIKEKKNPAEKQDAL